MVTSPQDWVIDFSKAGADRFTFHIESQQESTRELCLTIKQYGMQCGIALKPGTAIEGVYEFVDAGLVDLVLIMMVEPGFGGQKMLISCIPKIEALRKRYPSLDIQVDGGIDVQNVDLVARAGANVIVSGTGIFGHADPHRAITEMSAIVGSYL